MLSVQQSNWEGSSCGISLLFRLLAGLQLILKVDASCYQHCQLTVARAVAGENKQSDRRCGRSIDRNVTSSRQLLIATVSCCLPYGIGSCC
jgi:hypothetical protein